MRWRWHRVTRWSVKCVRVDDVTIFLAEGPPPRSMPLLKSTWHPFASFAEAIAYADKQARR